MVRQGLTCCCVLLKYDIVSARSFQEITNLQPCMECVCVCVCVRCRTDTLDSTLIAMRNL